MTKKRKVVVIGGGITGLTAAYYLQQAADATTEVTVIESSLRVGGKIQTMRKNGFIFERGPESFVDTGASVKRLAMDLGIEDKLITHQKGQTYVAVGKDLYAIPGNLLYGGAPNVTSLMASNLISLSGKIRAAGDLFLPKSQSHEDVPIGEFFRKRFGNEVVENLVEPLLAGTFAGDIDHLSIRSMFPQFYQLEKEHRSLIVGMKKKAQLHAVKRPEGLQVSHGTFTGGLETIIEALEQKLAPNTIVKGVKVEEIERLEDGKIKVSLNSMPPIQADAIIMTTPFNIAKAVMKKYDVVQNIPNMSYATIATVTMAFKKEQLPKYKKAINFFVSRNSELAITSCTWSNRKWPGVVPEGHEMLRVYIGRVGDESIVELSDSEIEKVVLSDLQKVLDLQGAPLFTVVTRWKQAMPQYVVGHEIRLKQLEQDLAIELPNVKLIGSSYGGISVPDCVTQGREVAKNILKILE